MKKRISLFLAAIFAISALAGCGTKDAGKNNGEVTDLTIHMHFFDYCVYNNDWPIFKEAERLTGVRLTGTAPETISESAQAWSTMLSGTTLPDIIHYNRQTLEEIGKEGALIPLEDLIEEYAPNIKEMFEKYPDLKKYATATDGHIYFIPGSLSGLDSSVTPSRGWFIRADWLEKLGLEQPKTVEDFYNVLTAFRTQDPNGNGKQDEVPFLARQEGTSHLYQLFDASKNYILKDGKIVYGPIQEEYKNAIQEVAKWYKEGLIDQEIFTRGQQSRDQLFSRDLGGSTHDWFSSTASYNDKYKDTLQSFELVPMAPPADINGVVKEVDSRAGVHEMAWGISKDNKNVVETIKYFDFWMSPEGQKLNGFGVEGIHYTEENGEIKFTEAVLTAENGAPTYMRNQGQVETGTIGSVMAELEAMHELGKEGYLMYDENRYCVEPYPKDLRTDEEKDLNSKYFKDVQTYVNENEQKWITGAAVLDDAAWDKYVADIQSMHIAELEAMEHARYERELAK